MKEIKTICKHCKEEVIIIDNNTLLIFEVIDRNNENLTDEENTVLVQAKSKRNIFKYFNKAYAFTIVYMQKIEIKKHL